MAPQKTNADSQDGDISLNARERRMMNLALKLLPPITKTTINFEAFVAEFGQKDVKSARECFRQLCKKHGWFEGTAGNNGPITPTPKKTPAKRSTLKKARVPTDDDESDIEQTPTKKRKANPKKSCGLSEKVFKNEFDDDSDAEFPMLGMD